MLDSRVNRPSPRSASQAASYTITPPPPPPVPREKHPHPVGVFHLSATPIAKNTAAEWPLVVRVFAAVSTQGLPSRLAGVRSPRPSEPASGSVSDHAPIVFPCASGVRYCFF